MSRFIIDNGLPYLLAAGKTYAVRFDESGFTVGSEVQVSSEPETTYSELEILAKCEGHLDSILDNSDEKPEEKAEEREDATEEKTEEKEDVAGEKSKVKRQTKKAVK